MNDERRRGIRATQCACGTLLLSSSLLSSPLLSAPLVNRPPEPRAKYIRQQTQFTSNPYNRTCTAISSNTATPKLRDTSRNRMMHDVYVSSLVKRELELVIRLLQIVFIKRLVKYIYRILYFVCYTSRCYL